MVPPVPAPPEDQGAKEPLLRELVDLSRRIDKQELEFSQLENGTEYLVPESDQAALHYHPASPQGTSGPRVLKVQLGRRVYEWCDLVANEAAIESGQFHRTLQDNIAYYFDIPKEYQAVFHGDHPLRTMDEYLQVLHQERSPVVVLEDCRQMSRDRLAQMVASFRRAAEDLQHRGKEKDRRFCSQQQQAASGDPPCQPAPPETPRASAFSRGRTGTVSSGRFPPDRRVTVKFVERGPQDDAPPRQVMPPELPVQSRRTAKTPGYFAEVRPRLSGAAPAPVLEPPRGGRMLRVEFLGMQYDWLDIENNPSLVLSPNVDELVRENVAHYFGVPEEYQLLSDAHSDLRCPGDFLRMLMGSDPFMKIQDARKFGGGPGFSPATRTPDSSQHTEWTTLTTLPVSSPRWSRSPMTPFHATAESRSWMPPPQAAQSQPQPLPSWAAALGPPVPAGGDYWGAGLQSGTRPSSGAGLGYLPYSPAGVGMSLAPRRDSPPATSRPSAPAVLLNQEFHVRAAPLANVEAVLERGPPGGDAPEVPVTLTKEMGKLFGMTIVPGRDSSSALLVTGVEPVGLLADWNRAHPGSAVSAGDWIVDVNGVRGDTTCMFSLLRAADTVQIRVRRAAS